MPFAHDGTQWVVCDTTIVVRRPGQTCFAAAGIAIGPRASLTEGHGGKIWLSDARGPRRIAPASGRTALLPHPASVGGTRMPFDRDGNLEEMTWHGDVLRIRRAGVATGGSGSSPAAMSSTSIRAH